MGIRKEEEKEREREIEGRFFAGLVVKLEGILAFI